MLLIDRVSTRPHTGGGRRRPRAAGALVAVAALLGCIELGALPAEAAPSITAPAATAPVVRLVGGDRTITASWSAVPLAASYTVRISTKRSMAHARRVTTPLRSIALKQLRNGHPYFVAVTANRPAVVTPATATAAAVTLPASTVSSATATGTAGSGVPLPVTRVTASPGDLPDQVRVDWTGGGRATKVAVVAGSSVVTNIRPFHSDWYPATTRSITITVPPELRPYIGSGSGNPVFVKVVQSNSSDAAFGPSYSYDRKYRPSPVGTWAFAKGAVPTPATPVSRLTVAELNTQTVEATRSFSKTNQWAARAPRVAAYIEAAHPDLLMTAELSTGLVNTHCANSVLNNTFGCSSHTQIADLARRLPGLQLADTDAYQRVMEAMRLDSGKWAGSVTSGAHIFFDPAKMTLLDHGFFAPARAVTDTRVTGVQGLGISPWNPKSAVGVDRWLSWAEFQLKDGTNRRFYAVAAHFPVGNAQVVVDTRAALGKAVVAAIDAKAAGTPVVFGGDMNSDAVRSPHAPQVTFIRDGWFDAAATATASMRTGMRVSTANGSGKQDGVDDGYGSKPVQHPYETSRIDYLLLKNSPYTFKYANVMRLNSDGTFVKALQGTDHNMQLADIGIGDPVAG